MFPARYWREIPQRYRLEAGKCKGCGRIYFPPRLVCAECKSKDFEQIKLKDPEQLEVGMKLKLEFRKIQQDGEAGILCYGYKCVPA